MDCEQRQIPDAALGPRQRTGEQDPGARRAATSSGLGNLLRPSSAAAGNPRGCQPLSWNLLSSGQLDLCGADHRARSHGSRAQGSRPSHQRHLPLPVGQRRQAAARQRAYTVNKYVSARGSPAPITWWLICWGHGIPSLLSGYGLWPMPNWSPARTGRPLANTTSSSFSLCTCFPVSSSSVVTIRLVLVSMTSPVEG